MNSNSSNGDLPVPIMDFDPVPFDEATAMFTDDEKYKYIRCLRFYWYHTHVQGIPDDDAGMMELCHCDPSIWPRLKRMIFDNDKFFYLENGKWHQKRARKAYQSKQESIIKKQSQTDAARDAKLAAFTLSKSVTDSVNGHPTPGQLILLQTALKRVEARVDYIKGQLPLPKSDKRINELVELKIERRKIMAKLGLRA